MKNEDLKRRTCSSLPEMTRRAQKTLGMLCLATLRSSFYIFVGVFVQIVTRNAFIYNPQFKYVHLIRTKTTPGHRGKNRVFHCRSRTYDLPGFQFVSRTSLNHCSLEHKANQLDYFTGVLLYLSTLLGF